MLLAGKFLHWGVRFVVLLLCCLCTLSRRLHDSHSRRSPHSHPWDPWKLEIQGSTGIVRKATDFYEALAFAAAEGTLQEILLTKDFFIDSSVWSPAIVLKRNLTIRPDGFDVTLTISKAATLVSVEQGTLTVKGFDMNVIDSDNDRIFMNCFTVAGDGKVELVDMLWRIPQCQYSNLKASPPSGAEKTGEGVNSDVVIVEDVQTKSVVYKNLSISSIREIDGLELGKPVARTATNGTTIARAFQIATRDGRVVERVDINIWGNATLRKADVLQIAEPLHFRRIVKINGQNGSLRIESDLLFYQLGRFTPRGRLHFENIILYNEFGNTLERQMLSSRDMFSWIDYPQDITFRCMTSFSSSTIYMSCGAVTSLITAVSQNELEVQEVDIYDSQLLVVNRSIGGGVCMEDVIVTCISPEIQVRYDRLDEGANITSNNGSAPSNKVGSLLGVDSRRRRDSDGMFKMQDPPGNKSEGQNYVIWIIVGVIVVVSILVASVAYIRGFGRGKKLPLVWRNPVTGSKKQFLFSTEIGGSARTSTSKGLSPKSFSQGSSDFKNLHDSWLRDFGDTDVSLDDMDVDEQVVQVDDYIGSGGYGVVYKGRWKCKPVAIKTVSFEEILNVSNHKKQRAILEAGIGLSLSHSNIVQTYAYTVKTVKMANDKDATDSKPDKAVKSKLYMLQEYCEGGTLRHAMEQSVFLHPKSCQPNLNTIVQIALDIAQGMRHLHSQNIIHGDLTAKNILLRQTPERSNGFTAKIADFGLSVRLHEAENHLQNFKAGTPLYMAPEVGQHGILTRKADIYSFGVVLWEMYNSALPKPMQCKRKGRNVRIPVICPMHWALLIGLCLSARPLDRPEFEVIVRVLTNLIGMIKSPRIQSGEAVRKDNLELASKIATMTRTQLLSYLLGVDEAAEPELLAEASTSCLSSSFPKDFGDMFTSTKVFSVDIEYCPQRGLEFMSFLWPGGNDFWTDSAIDGCNASDCSKTCSPETERSSAMYSAQDESTSLDEVNRDQDWPVDQVARTQSTGTATQPKSDALQPADRNFANK